MNHPKLQVKLQSLRELKQNGRLKMRQQLQNIKEIKLPSKLVIYRTKVQQFTLRKWSSLKNLFHRYVLKNKVFSWF